MKITVQTFRETPASHQDTTLHFVLLEQPKYLIGSVAKMLRINDHVIRDTIEQMGIEVERNGEARKARLFTPANVFDIAAYRRQRGLLTWDHKPLTISIYSAKGGVGKSTIAVELAIQWAFRGLRILVIDLDTQGNLTQIFGYDPELEDNPDDPVNPDLLVERNFASLFEIPPILPTPYPLADVIKKPYGEHGPHLIPADVTLAHLEDALLNAQMRDLQVLRLLKQGRDHPTPDFDLSAYDIILFDAPPATSMLTNTALLASDLCVSPVRLDTLSFKGLSILGGRLQNMRKQAGAAPAVIAIPTFYRENRLRITKMMNRLNDHYGSILSENMIRETEEFQRALVEKGMPLSLATPGAKIGIPDIQDVADELLTVAARIDREQST